MSSYNVVVYCRGCKKRIVMDNKEKKEFRGFCKECYKKYKNPVEEKEKKTSKKDVENFLHKFGQKKRVIKPKKKR